MPSPREVHQHPRPSQQVFEPVYPKPRERLPGPAGTVYHLFKNPIDLLTRDHYRTDVVVDRLFGLRAISLNNPEYIRQVLITNRSKYGIDPIRKLLLSRNFGQGLATVEGQPWHEMRRVAAKSFSEAKVRSYAAVFSRTADSLCQRQPDQQSCKLSELASEVAFENAVSCLFSLDQSSTTDSIVEANAEYVEHGFSIDPLDVMRLPEKLPRLFKTKSTGRIALRHRAIVDQIYRDRVALMDSGNPIPDDLLSGICRHFLKKDGPSDAARTAAVDNIGTMLGASYETTARVIGWTLYLLSQSPSATAAVRTELDAGEHDQIHPGEWRNALPWLVACLRETMRLYPPLPGIVRYALEHDTIGSEPVRKGDYVVTSMWLLQRSDRRWGDGARFRPDRFLPGGEATALADCYMPFGIGPRACIGRHFAELEAVIVLAKLLRHFDFQYAGAQPAKPVWKGTLRSDNGFPVIMSRRS